MNSFKQLLLENERKTKVFKKMKEGCLFLPINAYI